MMVSTADKRNKQAGGKKQRGKLISSLWETSL